ncbi:MAG: InlB B-repeat-containing protein [Acholeplasmatales bacterium]|jgi:M6 family metalloprotease-like protein/uncharacterized repeat protein (TIGR02543 family)|nr:InlB B-repeat-containing protein [Acholeplasmatales bacterium]
MNTKIRLQKYLKLFITLIFIFVLSNILLSCVTQSTYKYVKLSGTNVTLYGESPFNAGESATVYASADPGYYFKEWTTSNGEFVSSDNPYTFTVGDVDVSLKAVVLLEDRQSLTISYLNTSISVLLAKGSLILENIDSLESPKGYKILNYYYDDLHTSVVLQGDTLEEDVTIYASLELLNYTVKFENSTLENITYNIETPNFMLPIPVLDSYVFLGWYDNASFAGEVSTYIYTNTLENITLYAKYELIKYNVTFIFESLENVVTVNIFSKVNAPTDPIKPNYFFNGWFLDGEAYDFSSQVLSNITLYAHFLPIISFVTNGGTAIDDIIASPGSAISWPSNPTLSGYYFTGWYTDITLETPYLLSNSIMPVESITLYASYQLVENVTVHFVTNISDVFYSDVVTNMGEKIDEPLRSSFDVNSIYSIYGWYEALSTEPLVYKNEPWDFSTDIVTLETTLYAVWGTVNSSQTVIASGIFPTSGTIAPNMATNLHISTTIFNITKQDNDSPTSPKYGSGGLWLYPYNGNGNSITITSTNTIKSISITVSDNRNFLSVNGTTKGSSTPYSIESKTVVIKNVKNTTLTSTGSQVRISSISIEYYDPFSKVDLIVVTPSVTTTNPLDSLNSVTGNLNLNNGIATIPPFLNITWSSSDTSLISNTGSYVSTPSSITVVTLSATVILNGITKVTNFNLTLVNKWLVTFDSNGGTQVSNQYIFDGRKATKPSNPTLQNYVFVGWFEASSSVAWEFNTNLVHSNMTLEAIYELNQGPVYTQVGDVETFDEWELNYNDSTCMPDTGTYHVPVIPIQFSDSQFTNQNLIDLPKVFNGTASQTGWESVQSFYSKSSFGKLNITFDILPVYTAAHNSSWYNNKGENDQTIEGEAMDGVDSAVNFSNYDYNNDGAIDGVYFIYSKNYNYNDIWWAWVWRYFENRKWDGKDLNAYQWASIAFTYDSLGSGVSLNAETYIHETGHMLGQTDLYSNSGYGPLGGFDMMANNCGDMGPFDKLGYGWINPLVASTGTKNITLGSYSSTGDSIIFPYSTWNDNIYSEYLMIMYYTADGLYSGHINAHTSYVPTVKGIIIYHVDARKNSWGDDFKYNNSGSGTALVGIVPASGTGNISNGMTNAFVLQNGTSNISSKTWHQGGTYGLTIVINSKNSDVIDLTITYTR